MPTEWGRDVVKFYYRHSPPIAAYIEKREWVRQGVRGVLRPVVWIAKRILEKK